VLQYISFDWRMRDFVELGLVFFHSEPRDWLGETSPKWRVLFRVGRKTQSMGPQNLSSSSRVAGVVGAGGRRDEVRPSPNFPNFFGGGPESKMLCNRVINAWTSWQLKWQNLVAIDTCLVHSLLNSTTRARPDLTGPDPARQSPRTLSGRARLVKFSYQQTLWYTVMVSHGIFSSRPFCAPTRLLHPAAIGHLCPLPVRTFTPLSTSNTPQSDTVYPHTAGEYNFYLNIAVASYPTGPTVPWPKKQELIPERLKQIYVYMQYGDRQQINKSASILLGSQH